MKVLKKHMFHLFYHRLFGIIYQPTWNKCIYYFCTNGIMERIGLAIYIKISYKQIEYEYKKYIYNKYG